MPQNFIEGRREQGFLLPPDVRDWLPADHLAWFVIDAVAGMNLDAFYASYRSNGHGRAAYEPSLMVMVLLYAFATGVRSSRAIERHCRQDVAYRVITGNLVPDHVTITRFVGRHERALSELFTEVLKLCQKAGLVKAGVVSIDGRRIAGNCNPDVNCKFEQLAREILAETIATDEAEDEIYGEARGDELPEELRTAEGRREFFVRPVRSSAARVRRRSRSMIPRGRRARRPSGRPRPSSSSTAGGSSTRVVGAGDGCRTLEASWSSIAGRTRIRSDARARTDCCWRRSDWRPI